MKAKVPFLLAVILLTGCLGPKKIDKWVDNKYVHSISAPPKIKADYLTVSSPLLTANTVASTTKKQVKNFLPLVVYWQFDYVNTCTLNPAIPVNTFKSTVQAYANSKGLKQKLAGQSIELSIEKIPNVFVLNDRGHVIWVVYAYAWDHLTFRPDSKNLVVAYTIKKDNIETKKGTVTIANTDKELKVRFLQTMRAATGQYLDQYNESIKSMTKKVVDQLLTEI
mgnify:CR=1 FL=1